MQATLIFRVALLSHRIGRTIRDMVKVADRWSRDVSHSLALGTTEVQRLNIVTALQGYGGR
jgi:hypothetical protein